MKKYILTLILLLIGWIGAYSQFTMSMETSAYINGNWTSWRLRNVDNGLLKCAAFEWAGTTQADFVSFRRFRIREFGEELDNWCFSFEIDDYERTDKETRKAHYKNSTWYEYSGWVEYYVTDNFPTIKRVLEVFEFPLIQPHGETLRAKRRAKATIKIAPYKKAPTVFNIFFDGVGVALAFDKCPFDKVCFVR
jgi:hypothetical protein